MPDHHTHTALAAGVSMKVNSHASAVLKPRERKASITHSTLVLSFNKVLYSHGEFEMLYALGREVRL